MHLLVQSSLEVQQKKLEILFENTKYGWLGLIILWIGLLFAYELPNSASVFLLSFLLFIGLIAHVINNHFYSKWQIKSRLHSALYLKSAILRWRVIIVFISLYNALIFGVSPLFLLDISNVAMIYLVVTLLVLPIFGAAVVSGTDRVVNIFWMLGLTQIMVFILLTSEQREFVVIGLMLQFGALPTAILMNYYFHKLYTSSIELGLQNKKLLAKTEYLKEIANKESAEKSWLIDTMSHDLSQPIQALNIFLDCLKLEVKDGKQLEIVNKSKQAGQELSNMLQSIMNLSSSEQKILKVNIQIVNIKKIIQNLVNEFEQQAVYKQIELIYNVDNVEVLTDQLLLNRVIRNLLDNAIKHNNNCKVTVTTRVKGGDNQLELKICDTGKGISDQDLDKVFNAHYQADISKQGRGLGLSLVKRATEELQLSMEIESLPEKGTCFRLYFSIA